MQRHIDERLFRLSFAVLNVVGKRRSRRRYSEINDRRHTACGGSQRAATKIVGRGRAARRSRHVSVSVDHAGKNELPRSVDLSIPREGATDRRDLLSLDSDVDLHRLSRRDQGPSTNDQIQIHHSPHSSTITSYIAPSPQRVNTRAPAGHTDEQSPHRRQRSAATRFGFARAW